jgi:hypothetical protein
MNCTIENLLVCEVGCRMQWTKADTVCLVVQLLNPEHWYKQRQGPSANTAESLLLKQKVG